MSCEIHDDQWHCFLQEGEWVHIKKEEWNKSEMEPGEIEFKTPESYDGKKSFKGDFEPMPEVKPNSKVWGFNPFGRIWDILNGEG